MSKRATVINTHSFVDVITNSSSELFVLDTGKSLEVFKELLNELISEYNKKVQSGVLDEEWGKGDMHRPREAKLDDFDEPFVYTKEEYNLHKAQDELDLAEQQKDYDEQVDYGKTPWSKPCSYLWGYEQEDNVGKIILESRSSNTIPYEMWDMINDTFNGVNYHLG